MPDASKDKKTSTAAARKPATDGLSINDQIEVVDRLPSAFPLGFDEAKVIDRIFGAEIAKLSGE